MDAFIQRYVNGKAKMYFVSQKKEPGTDEDMAKPGYIETLVNTDLEGLLKGEEDVLVCMHSKSIEHGLPYQTLTQKLAKVTFAPATIVIRTCDPLSYTRA